ncbi:MAG TPA: hypothetical protein VG326_20270 [Tepidisphaeraceae bacterium]|nr:hypothetical protein [Tepidisphaeraceae bacterium]
MPDQHGGRKGLCPICQGVNRIPLKGYAETQPNSPTVARTAPASAQTPMNGERENAAPPPSGAPLVDAPSATIDPESVARQSSVSPPSPQTDEAPAPAKAPATASPERFTAATKFIAPPDDAANLRAMRRAKQEAAKTEKGLESPRRSAGEGRLPKKIKLALLILAALAIVAALYFGLLMALRAAVPDFNSGR